VLRGKFGLDGVVEIDFVDGGVNFVAFVADVLQVGVDTFGHDFVDLTVAELRAQAACNARGELGAALREVADKMKSGVDAVDGEANRMRKFGIQEQEFGDAQRTNLRGVSLAISFQSDAATE